MRTSGGCPGWVFSESSAALGQGGEGGSLGPSLRTPRGRWGLVHLSVPVRSRLTLRGTGDPYLRGLGRLAAPRAPPGRELLRSRAVLVARAGLAGPRVPGSPAGPSAPASPACPGFLRTPDKRPEAPAGVTAQPRPLRLVPCKQDAYFLGCEQPGKRTKY